MNFQEIENDIVNNDLIHKQYHWICPLCLRENIETEGRNFLRRKNKCSCQILNDDINKKRKCLFDNGFLLIDFSLTDNSTKIDTKKIITVKCVKCDRIINGYYYNILKGHKKCNCDSSKKFTRDLDREDFINKWTEDNKKHFILIDNTSHFIRNKPFLVECTKCHYQQQKWGISLMDQDCTCINCESYSLGERKIAEVLFDHNINYIPQYKVEIDNHIHYFDFFLPEQNSFIEYNGLQHYMPIDYFGGEKGFINRQQRDKEKLQYCLQNNYVFITIRYDENIEEILAKSFKFND